MSIKSNQHTNQQPSSNKDWHYHPALPLQDASVFSQIKSPKLVLGWFIRNWLSLSEFIILVLLAVVLWAFCYPSLDQATTFQLTWIAQNLFCNLILMLGVAGGLHWYFYIRQGQGKKLKFDHREQTRNNRSFLFSDQVKDNMFWSLTSGVFHLTFFQSLTMWLMANQYIPVIQLQELSLGTALWFLLGFVLLPIWSAFHFYWVHRFLHQPFMYRRFHSLHHKNINVGPWSGLAMHPVEHLLYISSLAIHWLIASHPLHVIFHVIWLGPGAAMTHTGYENLLVKNKRRLALGTFYHQLHHRYFECNYGNQEMPWDRWFGTFHDGSETATKETRERKKRMYS